MQEFLPNTAPAGGTDPYAAYPSGYLYRTSNGNSTREAGSIELRRRFPGITDNEQAREQVRTIAGSAPLPETPRSVTRLRPLRNR